MSTPTSKTGGTKWHVARNKQKAGPYSAAQLKQQVAAGQLRPDDMLLREGAQQWVRASAVRGLFPEPAAAAAAPGPGPTPPPAAARPKRRRMVWLLTGAAAILFMTCTGAGISAVLILPRYLASVTPSPQAKLDENTADPVRTATVPLAPPVDKGTETGTKSPTKKPAPPVDKGTDKGSGAKVPAAERAPESTIQGKLLGRWEATKGEIPPGSIVEFTKDGKLKVTIKVDGKTLSDESTYVVQGEAIKATHKEGPKEVTETLKIRSLTESVLVTEDAKGKTEEFRKHSSQRADAGAGAEPADGTSNRAQALAWVRSHNAFGPGHRLVKDVQAYLDSYPDAAHGFQLKLGAGLVKSGKATLLAGWRRGFWIWELSAEQSAKVEKAELQRTMMRPLPDMGEVPPDFAISPPVFDAGSSLPVDKPITGRLPFRNVGRESRGYPSIRLTHWPGTAVSISYSHYRSKFVGKEDKEFKFKFSTPKEVGCAPGPVLFMMDVVEFPDDARTGKPFVVSNPVAVLVMVSDKGEVSRTNDAKLLTAEALTRAFKENEDAARKKYGGLVALTVEGVVREVFVDKMGEPIVYLKGATDRPGVACTFDAKADSQAVKLQAGQRIIVAGRCYGLQGADVLLGFCKLLPTKGKSPGK